jgi:hypothetical protein
MTAVPDAKSLPPAEFILDLLNAALSFNIRVGAAPDASEMIVVYPPRLPREIARWFQHELYSRQHEIVDFILRKNAGRF